MSFGDRLSFLAVHIIDKQKLWHRLPMVLGLLYLERRRFLHDKYNMLNVDERDTTTFNPDDYPCGTTTGVYNDPSGRKICNQNTLCRRHMPHMEHKNELLSPDPVVAAKLLARGTMKDTGKQFSVIAAAWVQFMIHDWLDYLVDTDQITLTTPSEVASQCPLKSFKFNPTKELPTNGDKGIKTGHINIRTHWRDASANYGSSEKKSDNVRTFVDGKLKLGLDNHLLHDDVQCLKMSVATGPVYQPCRPSLSRSTMLFVMH